MTNGSVGRWIAGVLFAGVAAAGAYVVGPSGSTDPLGASTGSDARPNVLLITIDTLRADHLPMYGYSAIETPALSALAEHATVFEHGRSHAPITLPSHTSIMTGLYPPQHGVRSNGSYVVGSKIETLAERLSAVGYATAAFVSAFVLDSRFGLDQGFDYYDDDLEDGRTTWSKFGVKDRRAGNTVNRALSWINRPPDDAPYFAWVHLYDPHFEYAAPEPFASRYPDPYDAEIAYTDSQIGRMLEGLRSRPDFDEMMIVVTADHGESRGEHGESTHSLFIYEGTQHVPMIIRFPGGRHAGVRSDITARHVDLVPTILDALGETEAGADSSFAGRSLLHGIEQGEAAQAQLSYAEAMLPEEQFGWSSLHAIEQAGFKYIEAPRPELYSLDQDPTEMTNLVEQDSERSAAMSLALQDLLSRLEGNSAPSSQQAMDEETRVQLAALGYLFEDEQRNTEQGRDPKDMIEIYEARERVHTMMNSSRYAEAIELSLSLAKKDPTNLAITQDLAACHAELGLWDDALDYYSELVEAKPENAGARLGLAKVRFKGFGDFAQAETDLDIAMALAPDDPSIWGVRGDLLHEMGRYADAAASYERAIDGGDQTASHLLGWASALNLTNRLGEARDAIERAVRLEPRNPIAHFNHGVILDRMGLQAVAEGAFREALRLEPELSVARATISVRTNRSCVDEHRC